MVKKRNDEELMSKVAERLKELRHKKGITQEVVYFDTNVNIKRIEVGSMNLSLTTLSILCDYYGVTLEDFFKGLK